MEIRNLSQFRAALAKCQKEGIKVRCIHSQLGDFGWRQILICQTTAVAFLRTDGKKSWMYFESSKHWIFDGSNIVKSADGILTYELPHEEINPSPTADI